MVNAGCYGTIYKTIKKEVFVKISAFREFALDQKCMAVVGKCMHFQIKNMTFSVITL